MDAYVQWYWEWGHFVFGVLIFICGFLMGFFECRIQEKVKRMDEAYRLAITDTIPESVESEDSHLQSGSN